MGETRKHDWSKGLNLVPLDITFVFNSSKRVSHSLLFIRSFPGSSKRILYKAAVYFNVLHVKKNDMIRYYRSRINIRNLMLGRRVTFERQCFTISLNHNLPLGVFKREKHTANIDHVCVFQTLSVQKRR